MIGTKLGSYHIVEKIGGGGMGTVYMAEDTYAGRRAAIKVLHPQFSDDPEIIARFFNEARAASRMDHHGIVKIYDYGTYDGGYAFIVMEYLEGEDLAKRLRRVRRLPVHTAMHIGRQVSKALAATHVHGIIHRDLKPDNLFLLHNPDGVGIEQIKILDFGVAKLLKNDNVSLSKTRTGTVIGTPTYMSPEQCKGTGDVDHRADLYSLGCILFRMMCGRTPFLCEGYGEMLAAHIHTPPPDPRSLEPSIPVTFNDLVLRLMAKDPADRYQSAEALIDAIEDAVANTHLGLPDPALTDSQAIALRDLPKTAGERTILRQERDWVMSFDEAGDKRDHTPTRALTPPARLKVSGKPQPGKSQPVRTGAPSRRAGSRPRRAGSRPRRRSSRPVHADSQPIVSDSQPILADSQPILSDSQPILLDTPTRRPGSQPSRSESQPTVLATPSGNARARVSHEDADALAAALTDSAKLRGSNKRRATTRSSMSPSEASRLGLASTARASAKDGGARGGKPATTTISSAAAAREGRKRRATEAAKSRRTSIWLIGGLAAVAIAVTTFSVLNASKASRSGGATDPQTPVTSPPVDASAAGDTRAADAGPSIAPTIEPFAEIEIRIESKPTGAAVYRQADNTQLCVTPCQTSVPKSSEPIELRLSLAGHKDRLVTISGDRTSATTIELAPVEKRKKPRKRRKPSRRSAPDDAHNSPDLLAD